MRVAGVDGAKRGWVAVVLEDGAFAGAHLAATVPELIATLEPVDVIGVDMPIGLVDDGWRDCDLEARKLLGPRRSSVFAIPPRQALAADTHAEATAICSRLTGKGMSRQAHALRRKIFELEGALDDRIYEVHPEVSFARLADGAVLPTKHSWNGQARRRALLAAAGIELPDDLAEAGLVAPDDVLDAAVAAWTAARIARGSADRVPADPRQRDGDRVIAIFI